MLVDGQTTGGIDNHHLVSHGLCMGYGFFGNPHRILAALFGKHLDPNLFAKHFQLIDGRRAVNVAGHQQHLFAFFRFEVIGKLGRESGFTTTLQAGNKNNSRVALNVDFFAGAAHEGG